MGNYYRILGVPPSASPDSIRAAYLSLMKRHHPDALGGRDSEAEHKAQELNRAYAVLRDPKQRAEYDSTLDARTRVVLPPGPRRPTIPVPPQAHPGISRRLPANRIGKAVALWALMLSLGGVLGVLVAGIPEAAWRKSSSASDRELSAAAEPPVQQPPIDAGVVVDAGADSEFLFLNGVPADAVIVSRSCFAELNEMPSLKLLDRCIAFDLASNRWLSITNRGRQTSFFSQAAMKERHRGAFRKLSFGRRAADERIDKLDQLTVTDITLRLNRP